MNKLLVIGSVHADIAAYVDRMPKGEEDITPDRTEQRVDGSGWKTAQMFKGFDFPFELLAPCGSGVYGEYVSEEAKKADIELKYRSSALSGCTYHVIDRRGQESFFCVPGSEYDFSVDYLMEIYPEELDEVVLYGDMLQGDGVEEIIGTVQELEKPVYFAPGTSGDAMDEILIEEIFSTHPILHILDQDAYYLAGEKGEDLRHTAKALNRMTSAPVLIIKQKEGCWYCGDDEEFLAPEDRMMDPDLHLSAFMIARRAGIDVRSSLMYANRVSSEYRGRTMTDRDYEYEKKRLAGMILNK